MKTKAYALLDTGSLAGDFISQTFVDRLQGNKDFSYTSANAMTVCSGLDSTCYQSDQLIDICVTFHTFDNRTASITISPRINKATTVDLILGRETLNKYDFFSLTPLHLGMPAKEPILSAIPTLSPLVTPTRSMTPPVSLQSPASFVVISKQRSDFPVLCETPPDLSYDTTQPEAPVYRSGMMPNFSTCSHAGGLATHPCSQCMVPLIPTIFADDRKGDKGFGCFSKGFESHQLPAMTRPRREVGALLAAGPEGPSGIILSVDEIDNEKTDTFGPFVSGTASEGQPSPDLDFLNDIVFEGDEELQDGLRGLCTEYHDIFSNNLAANPADLKPFDIKIDKAKWEVPANRGQVRPQSTRKELEIKKAIDGMLSSGVIEISTAPYYSHPVIVQKTAGSYRCCIDYRNLNACTDAPIFPLPIIPRSFDRIGSHTPDTFGVMDLTSGYHQAPLATAARVLTAFLCFAGLFQFTRVPFGPKGAPSYFQEQMATTVLNGIIHVICEIYLDDCIVFGRGNKEFLERLRVVFQRFRDRGLLLKAKKCKFGVKRLEYVGRVISAEGTSMSKEKIESVLNFPRPKDKTSLQSLLGLANYFRAFVPHHSTIVSPLHRMIEHSAKKKSALIWTEEGKKAFMEIRIAISQCPLLHFVDDVSPIHLYTDASQYGVGGVLFQIVGAVWNPIAFVSKSLTATQLKWATIQTEAYAIFTCCQKLDYLLRDRKFTIHTDHQNLTYMTRNPSSMVTRWYIALQELDYTIEYVKGSQNTIADALSRLCPNLAELALPSLVLPVDEQNPLVAALEERTPANAEQLEALEMCHNANVGHGGRDRTIAKLLSLDYNWQYMRQHVATFIRECPCYQKMSALRIPINAHHYVTSSYSPFEVVNIDFIGPYPDSGYVLVVVCAFTRWTELYWCANATAACACDALIQQFGRFGTPSMIRSDRGSHFVNNLIKEFLDKTGTPHNLTLAYSKQENSLVERTNKEVNRHLRAFIFQTTDIDNYRSYLPFVQRILNASDHTSTGTSPASLLFGNRIHLDKGILLPTPEVPTTLTNASPMIADMMVFQGNLIQSAALRLRQADEKHMASTLASSSQSTPTTTPTHFDNDSHVLVQYVHGPPTRLHTKWEGPFKVMSSDKSEYTLRNLITKKQVQIHVSRLKQFLYDPAKSDPVDTARRDHMEFFVEEVLTHHGDPRRVNTLTFHVKWVGYDASSNT